MKKVLLHKYFKHMYIEKSKLNLNTQFIDQNIILGYKRGKVNMP